MTALLFAPSIWCLIGLLYSGIGVALWWERRKSEPVYTYGVLWPNGDLDDITRHDYQALLDQGYDELTDAYDHPEAYWDAWVEDALRMGHDTPTYDRLICEQYERDFREGK